MNRHELYQAQMQALKPPPPVNLTGLMVGVPASMSVEDIVGRMVEMCRSNLLSLGIDPDGEGAQLIRIDLPCGCSVVYTREEEIPRQSKRCYCGMNWFIQYIDVGEVPCPSCNAS